jgi:hypothetical protein
MRLITGDELGLLKEIVPELCRRREDDKDSSPSSSSSSSSIATKFAGGRSLPAVQRLDLSSSSGGGDGSSVTNSSSIPGRSAGIVSLAFLPPPLSSSSSSESCFNFAALRSNGIVETWRGTRGGKEQNEYDNGEANIIPASYIKRDTLTNGVVARSNNGDKNAETSPGHEVSSSSSNSSGGWYMNRPINPIGMVSSYIINNHARDDTDNNNGNPILVTCDSIGGLSIINTNKMNVVAQYETFMADSDTTTTPSNNTNNVGTSSSQLLQLLPLPSSSKNNPCNIGTLTHTKGARVNVDIATCLALTTSISGGTTALHVAVGGRERGTRLVNVETGSIVWKAKNLPPDTQTLLQRLMWTTSIQFLHGGGGELDNVMTCGTAYGQVQLYDVRASSSVRRPTSYTPDNMLSHRITSICQMGDNANILAVGDTIGDIHLLDIRKLSTGRYLSSGGSKKSNNRSGGEDIGLGRLAGPGGSIRQLVNHPTKSNVLACVGLDRKLWTWDITKKKKNGMKKPLDCVYLKQRLHCVLFCEDGDGTENKTDDNDYEESGNDVRYDFDDERGSIECGGLTRSKKELEEDAVEDYIDSDDDDNTNVNVNKRSEKSEKGLLEEETEFESDENSCSDGEDSNDNNVDESNDDDDESSESSGGDDDGGDGNTIASKRRRI